MQAFLERQEKKWRRTKTQNALAKAKYRFWMDQHSKFLGCPYNAYDY